MEIERKYTVKRIPDGLGQYPHKKIEQGYLCEDPIVRIRRSNDDYILTYKSRYGINETLLEQGCISNEMEAPLSKAGYEHLKDKVDNHMVCKTRYMIPLEGGLQAELDIFEGSLNGLVFAEVEFPDEEAMHRFSMPDWFLEDVSSDIRYQNNYLASLDKWE